MTTFTTIREAVAQSSFSYKHIAYLVSTQKINGRKSGNVWLVDLDSLKAYETKMQELGPQKHRPKSIDK